MTAQASDLDKVCSKEIELFIEAMDGNTQLHFFPLSEIEKISVL